MKNKIKNFILQTIIAFVINKIKYYSLTNKPIDVFKIMATKLLKSILVFFVIWIIIIISIIIKISIINNLSSNIKNGHNE